MDVKVIGTVRRTNRFAEPPPEFRNRHLFFITTPLFKYQPDAASEDEYGRTQFIGNVHVIAPLEAGGSLTRLSLIRACPTRSTGRGFLLIALQARKVPHRLKIDAPCGREPALLFENAPVRLESPALQERIPPPNSRQIRFCRAGP